jgi:hypothetical protein
MTIISARMSPYYLGKKTEKFQKIFSEVAVFGTAPPASEASNALKW